ncbi:hypothetical protein N7523_000803 [Penicillium sp. IBT 18751x]|nr:hypothetical protein N7523_000803 [Penicillium sp. IBT 18751x]
MVPRATTLNTLNELIAIKIVIDSEEAQRILKLPVAYDNTNYKFLTKRAALIASIRGIPELLQGKATDIYHQAFNKYDKDTQALRPITPTTPTDVSEQEANANPKADANPKANANPEDNANADQDDRPTKKLRLKLNNPFWS